MRWLIVQIREYTPPPPEMEICLRACSRAALLLRPLALSRSRTAPLPHPLLAHI